MLVQQRSRSQLRNTVAQFLTTTSIMSHSHWGLCYYSVQAYRFVSLPLITARTTATIKDLSAQVKVIQSFKNDASLPIEATYSFPIPARAAVCGFAMIRQNGTRVNGVVQEKTEAKQTYDAAVSQGKTASLMTQETPDVFQVAVGNILPSEEVSIELVYATELAEDEESDSVRFHLPTHIGTRYGHAPTISGNQATTVDIAVSVESIAPIRKIGSPSHSISTELGPDSSLPNAQELPFSNYARVSFYSTASLDKDFVLNIQSAGLDAPRCIAELHPNNDTVALELTLVPKFNLPDRATQEFIFLVDRSGSMQGHRIAAARKALVIMLRSLPRKDTIFQIVSFGNKATFMWPQGRLYDQETLDYATQYVDVMSADYGGTEIQGALSMTFSKRRTDRATNVFVLTDGDAWNLDGVLEEVKNAVGGSRNDAPLRVFCLGIGNSASTAMCQGIARCGKGACMMVGEQETSMTGKIARLVKAARMPALKDITLDWGRKGAQTEKEPEEDFEIIDDEESPAVADKEKPKLNIFDDSVNHMDVDASTPPPPKRIVLSAPSEVQQSPAKVEILLSGVRLYVYAILQGKANIPKIVTIRGCTDDGAEIELPVNVNLSHLPNESSAAPPAIHALAARKIIQDYEDGQYDALLRKESAFDLERLRKAHIVRLGTTFSITSSHTSFVAVDESSHTTLPTLFHPAGAKHSTANYAQYGASPRMSLLSSSSVPSPPLSMARSKYKMSASGGGRGGGRGSFSFGSASPKASFSPPPPPASFFSGGAPISAIVGGASPMLFGAAPSTSFSPLPPPDPGAFFLGAAPGDVVVDPQPMQQYSSSQAEIKIPTSDPLETLARLQGFDGSFTDLAKVVRATTALDEGVVRSRFPVGLDARVMATVLARAFIHNAMRRANVEEKVAWEGIDEKADEYLRETVGEYERLLEEALSIVL